MSDLEVMLAAIGNLSTKISELSAIVEGLSKRYNDIDSNKKFNNMSSVKSASRRTNEVSVNRAGPTAVSPVNSTSKLDEWKGILRASLSPIKCVGRTSSGKDFENVIVESIVANDSVVRNLCGVFDECNVSAVFELDSSKSDNMHTLSDSCIDSISVSITSLSYVDDNSAIFICDEGNVSETVRTTDAVAEALPSDVIRCTDAEIVTNEVNDGPMFNVFRSFLTSAASTLELTAVIAMPNDQLILNIEPFTPVDFASSSRALIQSINQSYSSQPMSSLQSCGTKVLLVINNELKQLERSLVLSTRLANSSRLICVGGHGFRLFDPGGTSSVWLRLRVSSSH